ncbi:oxysterol-binding protein homolog 7 [Trichomonascus vanleenenianus]|uniref:OSBP family protein n=1 Tax=Trichomonascus vanleenenianus TaxID=2268995 RepID=UPI003ECB40AE
MPSFQSILKGKAKSESPKPAAEPTTSDDLDNVDEVDSEGQNIILGIINQLRMGSDLSRITLPTFILERKSMLERITNQLQHPELLLEAHAETNPVLRFVDVVRWYLAGWHITPKAVKKPLNPVLGEHFSCYWDLPNGTQAFYLAEQTSHHPPKSSYFYMSPENHIRVDGTLVPKSRFLGNSAASIMEGIAYLKFLDLEDKNGEIETYELTQPNMYARGILIGTMKYELGDHSYVKCPGNDLIADIEFKTKGFISGTYNAIAGEIRQQSTGKVLFEISGKWNEVMEIKDTATGVKTELFNTQHARPTPPTVRPVDEQGEYESRRLWKKVTDALTKRDHNTATDEKYAIEERQRRQTRQREEEGVEFHPKMFKRVSLPLEFELYKDIDPKASPEKQVEQILSIAPILPGSKFHDQFEIPAFKKDSDKMDMSQLQESLPHSDKQDTNNNPDDDDDDDDEFVDAAA